MNWELLWDDQFGKGLRLLFHNPGSDIGLISDLVLSSLLAACSEKAGGYSMHMRRPMTTNKAMYEATYWGGPNRSIIGRHEAGVCAMLQYLQRLVPSHVI